MFSNQLAFLTVFSVWCLHDLVINCTRFEWFVEKQENYVMQKIKVIELYSRVC